MVRRSAANGARANCATAKSMPPLIEVRSAKERGDSSSRSPKACAAFGPSISIQSITTFWLPRPDHSTNKTAMRPLRPELMASSTRGLAIAAA